MWEIISGIFALIVAAAGWYYMFYSRAARNLSVIENESMNRKRQRLRQINGFCMVVLAVCMFAGVYTFDWQESPEGFVLVWVAVMILLIVILALVLADVRLTARLRDERKKRETGI